MKNARLLVFVLALWFALGLKPSSAAPDEYDDRQSHPLRVIAYLVHPAAFIVEWTLARPFHWLVSSTEPLEALFGHQPHPPVLSEPQPIRNYGVSKKVSSAEIPAKETQVSKPDSPQKPVAEKPKIVEVPVEKIVEREVPQSVEVENAELQVKAR